MNAALRLYPYIAIAAAAFTVAAGMWTRRRRKTPEQRERERRLRISETGRITDGTVIDVSHLDLNGSGEMQLLIYQYHVAGVSYEASQDITQLRHIVGLDSCIIGLAASVNYHPTRTCDSIVVAEH